VYNTSSNTKKGERNNEQKKLPQVKLRAAEGGGSLRYVHRLSFCGGYGRHQYCRLQNAFRVVEEVFSGSGESSLRLFLKG